MFVVASELIITFRETLEAALVVGIILSYLTRTKQEAYKKYVWSGLGAGLLLTAIGAYLFHVLAGGFTGRSEAIFEGITMLVGAGLLTTMILWMIGQENVAKKITSKVDYHVGSATWVGLFSLVVVSILREGIETIIFLNATLNAAGLSFGLALLGIVLAIIVSYVFFVSSYKLSLKNFFMVTNVLLILFAAGLVAHGVHELQEAEVIPVIDEHVWDINPEVTVEGEYPALHESGSVGGIAKGLFGYNGNPNLLEVISYVLYLGIVLFVWKKKTN